ncbi:MAG: ABC transporter ATP-binding protein [Bacteroidales bacterium]|jgi:ABC-type multidrug transport system ATPase subunit|nr:ABC transporter ATP-binding protein [Bacteroidales bacterium]
MDTKNNYQLSVVRCQLISLNYGKIEALKNVSFDVEKGELFGLIGADGAGKTTLFRILTTLLLADSGTATIDGLDAVRDYKEIRRHIGYMPGKFSLYQDLSIEENLNFFATVFGTTIKENYCLIEDIYKQIEPFKHRKAGQLSGGMKQKLALSCALIHKPSVLFLDEPTTGVDAVSRKEFWDMLKKLQRQGLTIIVSTPYMDEAALCGRIAFIQHGKILSIDTPEKIIADFPHKIYAVEQENNYEILQQLRQNPSVRSVFSFGDKLHVVFNEQFCPQPLRGSLESATNNLSTHYKHPLGRGAAHFNFKEIEPSIEDCFMELAN